MPKSWSFSQIQTELSEIDGRKVYPFAVQCAAFALIAGAFTIFFGGNFLDAAAAAVHRRRFKKLVVYIADKIPPSTWFLPMWFPRLFCVLSRFFAFLSDSANTWI